MSRKFEIANGRNYSCVDRRNGDEINKHDKALVTSPECLLLFKNHKKKSDPAKVQLFLEQYAPCVVLQVVDVFLTQDGHTVTLEQEYKAEMKSYHWVVDKFIPILKELCKEYVTKDLTRNGRDSVWVQFYCQHKNDFVIQYPLATQSQQRAPQPWETPHRGMTDEPPGVETHPRSLATPASGFLRRCPQETPITIESGGNYLYYGEGAFQSGAQQFNDGAFQAGSVSYFVQPGATLQVGRAQCKSWSVLLFYAWTHIFLSVLQPVVLAGMPRRLVLPRPPAISNPAGRKAS